MIKFKLNGKRYGFKREALEEQIINAVMDKINDEDNTGMRQMAKSAISPLMMFAGIKKPKEFEDMDNLEYAIFLALDGALNSLAENELDIEAYEIDEEETKEVEDNGGER